jgi:membrane dipeptidase
MNRLLSIAASTLILTAMSVAQTTPKHAKLTPEEVHRSAIVIDTHEDTPQRFVDDHFDLSDPLGDGQVNLDAIHKGNLGASFMSIWVEPELWKGQYARRTLELIDSVHQQAAKHPDQVKLVTTAEGIEAAHREHKYAMLMGIEGGHSIEDSLRLLRMYYDLGVRYMTLTWTNSNGWADSSGDDTNANVRHTKDGLSEFGKDVVYEMNRLGMMVDVSHVSDKTFYRTLIISRAPVIASHSGARALCDAPRNMTDDMLRAAANSGGPDSKGGVIMVNFYSGFISQKYRDAQKAQSAEVAAARKALIDKYKAEGKMPTYTEVSRLERSYADRIPRPPLSDLIDQIDHIAKVAGIDHVGLGSDFDGVEGQLPEGMDSAADLPKITAELMKRGYSAEDCRKILGGNFLRVFKEVEAVAKELQAENRPRISEKQPFEKQAK